MVKLYWIFYRSLLQIITVASLAFTVVLLIQKYLGLKEKNIVSFSQTFLDYYPPVFLTGGIVFGLVYFEFYEHKQYYFFYNYATSKVKLFVSAIVINSFIGIMLQILFSYV